MRLSNLLVLPALALLSACASFDGTYSPDCAAYQGDRITLDNGRFTWDRFTDSVPVDDAGNPLDPTPGYPLQGSYRDRGGNLTLETDAGDTLDRLYVRRQDDDYFLLTEEQVERLDAIGEIPECALVLDGFEDAR